MEESATPQCRWLYFMGQALHIRRRRWLRGLGPHLCAGDWSRRFYSRHRWFDSVRFRLSERGPAPYSHARRCILCRCRPGCVGLLWSNGRFIAHPETCIQRPFATVQHCFARSDTRTINPSVTTNRPGAADIRDPPRGAGTKFKSYTPHFTSPLKPSPTLTGGDMMATRHDPPE